MKLAWVDSLRYALLLEYGRRRVDVGVGVGVMLLELVGFDRGVSALLYLRGWHMCPITL